VCFGLLIYRGHEGVFERGHLERGEGQEGALYTGQSLYTHYAVCTLAAALVRGNHRYKSKQLKQRKDAVIATGTASCACARHRRPPAVVTVTDLGGELPASLTAVTSNRYCIY
jgi:hypothetical protein